MSTSFVANRKKGRFYMTKGDEALINTVKSSAFLNNDTAIWYYYQAAIAYKTAALWRESGDALTKCANVFIKMKLNNEAACIFVDAGEAYIKIDKGEAIASFKSAISIYCETGRFDVAGKVERKIARMHFNMKHWEEAAFHYRKSGNFFAGENLLDSSDICFDFSGRCLVEIKDLEGAKKDFETVALGCIQSNLRRFHAVDYLFRSIMCLIGMKMDIKPPIPDTHDRPGFIENEAPMLLSIQQATDMKYNRIEEAIKEYEQMDFLWVVSKEQIFLKNIIKHRREWSRHDFADHVYYWNNVRPIDKMSLLLLKVMYQEFVVEFERRAVRVKRLDAQKTRRERRIQQKKEMKEIMKKLGLPGPIVLEPDEEDKRLSAIIAGDRSLIDVPIAEDDEDDESGNDNDVAKEGQDGEDEDIEEDDFDEMDEEEEEEEEDDKADEEPKKVRRRRNKIQTYDD